MPPSKTLCGLNHAAVSAPHQMVSGTHWVYGEINCPECRVRLLEGIEEVPEILNEARMILS